MEERKVSARCLRAIRGDHMLKAVNLKTEYLINPMGIDINRPRVQWQLAGTSNKQTSYEICTGRNLPELLEGTFTWRSGKISSESMGLHDVDVELTSRQRVYWKVRIWDEQDQVGNWSEPAFFEMGLLQESEWQAQWITGDYLPEGQTRYPVDEFRKSFSLPPVKQARLYMTACGVYDTRINGKKIGNQVLTPGSTTYEKRVHYQTYDVTEALVAGENVWDISLGDGWYRGKLGVFGATNVFGETTSVIGQLEILTEDDQVMTIVTDKEFQWSNDGPIQFNDLKDGETVVAENIPTYSHSAKEIENERNLCSANNVLVMEQEEFSPRILKTPDGSHVLDFGQTIAGYVRFRIKGIQGHQVRLVLGEMLDEDGNFTLKNLITEDTTPEHIPDYCDDSRFQTILYTCGSNEEEQYQPRFSVQGFRYVKVVNWPEPLKAENFTAIAVYSGMEELSTFTSSSTLLNKLVKNTLWSIKGNFLDVPTDCPTRERAAWTGDAQLFFNAGCYFMDFSAFFRKWIRDVFDDQAPDGKIYNIVPRVAPHGGMNDFVEGSSGWTDAGILLPYRYWKHYGDRTILQQYYGHMKHLADFLLSRVGAGNPEELDQVLSNSRYRPYLVTTGFHFGEWNEPGSTPLDVMSPKFEEATAYLIYTLSCFVEIAEELGYQGDADFYRSHAAKSKEAYQFYFCPNDKIESTRMCQYVRPLALDLLSPKQRKNAQLSLKKLVEASGYHVGTGFLSTPFLAETISQAGHLEDAYQMIENESYPSWLYEIHQGATTVWENWDGTASLNHYSNGAVCEWLFKVAGGISLCGENQFLIAPQPGGQLQNLSFVYKSMYGKVSSAWRKDGANMIFTVTIPVGCQGSIVLPNGHKETVLAGDYTFNVPMDEMKEHSKGTMSTSH